MEKKLNIMESNIFWCMANLGDLSDIRSLLATFYQNFAKFPKYIELNNAIYGLISANLIFYSNKILGLTYEGKMLSLEIIYAHSNMSEQIAKIMTYTFNFCDADNKKFLSKYQFFDLRDGIYRMYNISALLNNKNVTVQNKLRILKKNMIVLGSASLIMISFILISITNILNIAGLFLILFNIVSSALLCNVLKLYYLLHNRHIGLYNIAKSKFNIYANIVLNIIVLAALLALAILEPINIAFIILDLFWILGYYFYSCVYCCDSKLYKKNYNTIRFLGESMSDEFYINGVNVFDDKNRVYFKGVNAKFKNYFIRKSSLYGKDLGKVYLVTGKNLKFFISIGVEYLSNYVFLLRSVDYENINSYYNTYYDSDCRHSFIIYTNNVKKLIGKELDKIIEPQFSYFAKGNYRCQIYLKEEKYIFILQSVAICEETEDNAVNVIKEISTFDSGVKYFWVDDFISEFETIEQANAYKDKLIRLTELMMNDIPIN